MAASKSKTQETYARRLNLSLIQYLRECHAADADLENIEHRPGAFSAMRLNELSLLARRDKTVADRYGLKRIESIFEHRLALVFQSFGFYVVSTRKGKSTVDLYCVSPSPKGGYSFMVEAKTSKRAYSLSPRDSRAIAQYVTDAESGLTTLPPLKFVLLLAHQAASTMNRKLVEAEASIGLPLRFATASQIAQLRESLPGPLPPAAFLGEVLRSPSILPEDFAARVAQGYEAVQGAHVKFAEQLLSVHKGQLPKPESSG